MGRSRDRRSPSGSRVDDGESAGGDHSPLFTLPDLTASFRASGCATVCSPRALPVPERPSASLASTASVDANDVSTTGPRERTVGPSPVQIVEVELRSGASSTRTRPSPPRTTTGCCRRWPSTACGGSRWTGSPCADCCRRSRRPEARTGRRPPVVSPAPGQARRPPRRPRPASGSGCPPGEHGSAPPASLALASPTPRW